VAELKRRKIPVKFHLAGRLMWPRAEEEVAKALYDLQIAELVQRIPPYRQAEAPAIYQAAHILVHPKYKDPCPTVPIEAMACGVPVVTGRTAALAEIGGGAIEHVDRIEPEEIGERLVALAASRERREDRSQMGLARAATFSWQRAARESLEVYRETANAVSRAHSRAGVVRGGADPLPHVGTDLRVGVGTDLRVRPSRVPSSGPTRGSAPATVDVLFGQAYFLRFDPKLWAAQQPYAPLGALYAAACVRERGYSVALFDAMLAASESEWAASLDRHRPTFAVIYEDNFNYLSKMCLLRMRQAALTMIDAARARGIATIVAGSDASDHPATYLDRGADVVVTGEGEVTLVELLDALAGRTDRPLTAVDGLWLRDADGRVVRTRPREIIRHLDALPFPAWDLVDVARYRSIWRSHHGYHSMNLVTTRGCPYHCNWCAKPIYGQRYTARSPEHVVEEMAWLKSTFGPDHLWIADDIFGLKPRWIERFADLVRARADQVTADAARALHAAQCRTAWIGAESGSQRILDAMEKGTRVEDIARATRLLHEAGVEVGFFLQFGYPGETRDDIDRTLAMVRDCAPDDIGVSVSYPLPGTTFYQRVQAQLGQKQNWVDSNDLAMMYHATYVPDFYRALHALVHAEFRSRKAATSVARAIARPWTLRQRHARAAVTVAYQRAKVPWIERRLSRLARLTALTPPTPLLPMLTPQAAAIPTDQASLK
jgi:radical SAM superfamily enzyme YgiQ (UPF0313 family)